MTTYTIFDTETTGLDPKTGDKIIEIAAVHMKDGKILDATFEELVNPQREISFEASQVSGITSEMLVGKPTIEQIFPRFLQFIEGTILVAHNAEFDMAFLDEALFASNPFGTLPPAICTKKLSRKLFPLEKFHNLDTVSYRLGITVPKEGRHRALTDVLLLADVFQKLCAMGNLDTPEKILALAKER